MKVIIPTAGSGTRLRPHTFTSPKTLLHVAGRPILDYLLEPLLDLPNLSELIFIVGDKGEQIREYVEAHYNLPTTYLWQDEQQGLGHAISLAKERDNGEPILILLGDKIFECGYQKIVQNPYTVIGVKMGENPQGVGIVETEGEFITRLIEKPENPPTNLVIEGAYYIQNSELLFQCLDEIIERDNPYPGRISVDRRVAVNVRIWRADEGCVHQLAALRHAGPTLDRQSVYFRKTGTRKIIAFPTA